LAVRPCGFESRPRHQFSLFVRSVAADGLIEAEIFEVNARASTNLQLGKILTAFNRLSMLKCTNCDVDIPDTEEKCLTCGFNAGPPNVRAAERAEEVQALEERYQKAFDTAKANGCLPTLEKFDESLKQTSAVINDFLDFLDFFTRSSKNLYTNYESAVEGRIRKPAPLDDDRERRIAGAIMFGGYAREIRYGALSLDSGGPQSYGPYAMKLKDIAIRSRATVLENNSYDFVQKHNLKPRVKLPLGYIAPWYNRHKLAVAKLAERITPSTDETEFARILLFSEGNRATDEFIEVHIYGPFDLNAVESIKGSSIGSSREDREILPLFKRRLSNAGIEWIEG
jgi:hypothetical protein